MVDQPRESPRESQKLLEMMPPHLHLPLDEIRVDGEIATAQNVGDLGGDALVHGNPTIFHDPAMGTCMRFDGVDDYLELRDLGVTAKQGFTVMAWVRWEGEATGYLFELLGLHPSQESRVEVTGSEKYIGFKENRSSIDTGSLPHPGRWLHCAFLLNETKQLDFLFDGQAPSTAYGLPGYVDIDETAWSSGQIGKGKNPGMFRGALAHFRIYNHVLTPAEVKDLMIRDRSAMSHYRETTLLKVELYTVRDDDHKPILYVEAENRGEPLEVNLTNPTDKPVAFKTFDATTADAFHVQLRFRRNVIAPRVLQALQKQEIGVEGWQYVAGTAADGREDYISFLKTTEPLTLPKGESWRVRIPNFSAAAQGGARNTRIQVRYRTEPQDPGSVVRHMEVQSHLGRKSIPMIARFRDSNTLLNDGKTSNELTVEVVYTGDTGSVRLDDDSKFELLIDNDLRKIGTQVAAHSATSWLEAQPAEPGIGHEVIPFEIKRPATDPSSGAQATLLEIRPDQPLTLEIFNWVTGKTSGMYNIVLRHLNIPGYWDGAWVLPVQFSPLMLRSNRIGIGTDEPSADLEIRRDLQGEVGPVLRLTNAESGANTAASIDFNVGPNGQGTTHPYTLRIAGRNRADQRTDLVVTGAAGGAGSELASITAEGRVRDHTGFVMPVGAILPYAGTSAPAGWLFCNGAVKSKTDYADLFAVIGLTYGSDANNSNVFRLPNLSGRVPVGHESGSPHFGVLGHRAGAATVQLQPGEMPIHSHEVSHDNPDGSHSHSLSSTKVDTPGLTGSKRVTDDENGSDWSLDEGGAHTHDFTIEEAGGGGYHNNLQPYIVLNYIIKY